MEAEKKNFFEETRELATKYVDDKILLLKLQSAEKAATFFSMLFKAIVASVIFFIVLAIASFLLGYYLSLWTGSFFYGFGILILIYIASLLLFLYAHKKYLHKSISDKMVELFFRNPEDK